MLKNTLIHSVTVIYTIAIAVLSLAHLTELPELNTGVDDKIVHFVLYAGLCLFWFMSLYVLKTKSSLLFIYKLIVDGKLKGKDVIRTRTPQRYGYHDLDTLIKEQYTDLL